LRELDFYIVALPAMTLRRGFPATLIGGR
jgi:hypothetical protein